jgi:hypothetical protein
MKLGKSRPVYFYIIVLLLTFLSCQKFTPNSDARKDKSTYHETENERPSFESNDFLFECDKRLKKKHSLNEKRELNIESINYKNQFRQFIQSRASSSKTSSASFLSLLTSTSYPNASRPSQFFKDSYIVNINNLPRSGLAEGKCWSGSYWPMRHVLIASRYGTDSTNNIGMWDSRTQSYKEYTYSKSASMIKQPAEYLEVLRRGIDLSKAHLKWSPAEKYDCLINDEDFGLTNWMLYQSSRFAKGGDIPGWYGICHGWTIASCYYPEPKRGVDLISADGKTNIHFYTADIKALLSQFWANCDYETGFVGTTCSYNDPKKIPRDAATGLYTDPKCSQVDAGAFLVVVANQIGIRKKYMNFDPFQNDEVWNQPLYKYDFKLYNLIDQQVYTNFESNLTLISKIASSTNSFLKYVYKYRESSAYYVVGLWIYCRYVVENDPIHTDGSERNYYEDDEYLAAIYLDRNYNILGGRWKYNYHPQFAWKAEETVPARGYNDQYCRAYDGSPSSLNKIKEYAKESSNYGLPMKCIINYLVQQSR